MTTPAGWFPDPAPPAYGQPPLLRYWDGQRWTEHTAPAWPAGAAGPPPAQSAGAPGGRATTPDGVPLAGWWHRVGAALLDGIILMALVLVLAFPWVREVVDLYREYFAEVFGDAGAGRAAVAASELEGRLAGPTLVISLISLAVGLVYHVGFLTWRQATPGKLMTGLRVRLRETPGSMPLGTVLLRWLGQFGVGIVSLVPIVGSLTGIYSLLDVLWPLWDGKRQALHDKVARTNVVRVR